MNPPTPSDPSPTARAVSQAAKDSAAYLHDAEWGDPSGPFMRPEKLKRDWIQRAIDTETAALRAEIKRQEDRVTAAVLATEGYAALQASIKTITAERDRLASDLEEQCRLLGMSGSREAKLLAELAAAQAERDAVRLDLENYKVNWEHLKKAWVKDLVDRDAWQVKAARFSETLKNIRDGWKLDVKQMQDLALVVLNEREALSDVADNILVCIEREKYEALKLHEADRHLWQEQATKAVEQNETLKELVKAQEKYASCNDYHNNDWNIATLKTKAGLT